MNIDIRNALINPDLVICDEGHRIKNHEASVAIALKSIKTQYKNFVFIQENLNQFLYVLTFSSSFSVFKLQNQI